MPPASSPSSLTSSRLNPESIGALKCADGRSPNLSAAKVKVLVSDLFAGACASLGWLWGWDDDELSGQSSHKRPTHGPYQTSSHWANTPVPCLQGSSRAKKAKRHHLHIAQCNADSGNGSLCFCLPPEKYVVRVDQEYIATGLLIDTPKVAWSGGLKLTPTNAPTGAKAEMTHSASLPSLLLNFLVPDIPVLRCSSWPPVLVRGLGVLFALCHIPYKRIAVAGVRPLRTRRVKPPPPPTGCSLGPGQVDPVGIRHVGAGETHRNQTGSQSQTQWHHPWGCWASYAVKADE
ncbi:uncharacterized protein CLUP02_12346 [Colletotrichum lupini]|uniref:Uncharacterized protein n=1 Tax=Colletotrichum lupini TaxID=145971 RepID=A0A9Q8WKL5_9PEZI|nr:uncharacterized protein CLUP02_12346 [Colletotrichum lupini]UQC86844.1 hypothetical protein CLUP02_12346 [Colletotrichum lupini]